MNTLDAQAGPEAKPEIRKAKLCINNMRMLDAATEQCALANNLNKGDVAPRNKVSDYIKNGIDSLRCPSSGQYTSGTVGADPKCSAHGTLTVAMERRFK